MQSFGQVPLTIAPLLLTFWFDLHAYALARALSSIGSQASHLVRQSATYQFSLDHRKPVSLSFTIAHTFHSPHLDLARRMTSALLFIFSLISFISTTTCTPERGPARLQSTVFCSFAICSLLLALNLQSPTMYIAIALCLPRQSSNEGDSTFSTIKRPPFPKQYAILPSKIPPRPSSMSHHVTPQARL